MTSLQKVIDALECLEQPEPASIEQILHTCLDDSLTAVKPYITEPDQLPYGRKVIFASDNVEATVIHLPPGSQTPIHNHGDAVGCTLVVSGMIINKKYRQTAWGTLELMKEEFVPKDYCFQSTRGDIHCVQNPSHVRAVTLQIYTPSLANMRYYEDLPNYIASGI